MSGMFPARMSLVVLWSVAWLAYPAVLTADDPAAAAPVGLADVEQGPIEIPVDVTRTPPFRVTMTPLGGGPRDGEPRDCPTQVLTYSTANFGGGQFVIQGGFVAGEIAAASYTVDPSHFPIIINLMEMVFAQQAATVTTTTQWSVLVWEGLPSTGNLVATYSSDGLILPHIVLPPGTNGVNVQVSIDPNDPEQIVVQNNGSNTFSVGFRIDAHNNPPTQSCYLGLMPAHCCPPATNSNAFPTTDTAQPTGANYPANNWLYCRTDCGPYAGCSGWTSFSSLGAGAPGGDWNLRVTYTPFNCPGYGACCFGNGSCQTKLQTECITAGGTWQGDGTSCSPNPCPQPMGACCRLDGTCSENVPESQCQAIGETFFLNTTCANVPGGCPQPDGACCVTTGGGCLMVPEAECDTLGGIWAGAWTDCSTGCNGACCFLPSGCVDLSYQNCNLAAGFWRGSGTTCATLICWPRGACCYPAGNCGDNVAEADCVAAGGTFKGHGVLCSSVSCPQPTGACCLSNGACLVLIQASCNQIPNSSWAGPFTTCADANQNGQADACESSDPCEGIAIGDFVIDGIIDGRDIQGFVNAFLSPGAPGSPAFCRADIDGNGVLNNLDIADFVTCVLSGTCPP